jgi:hypothetical protein
MEGGLIDGKTLRRALGVMTFGQGMVLLGQLMGLPEAEMAVEMGLRESDVVWFMLLARDEVARRVPEAEALLDAQGTRDGAACERLLEKWRAARAAGLVAPSGGAVSELPLGQEAGEVMAHG